MVRMHACVSLTRPKPLLISNVPPRLWFPSPPCPHCAVTPYLGFPNAAVLVSAWVKIANTNASQPDQTLLSYGTPANVYSFGLMVTPGTGVVTVTVGSYYDVTYDSNLCDNAWHLLVVTWTATDGTVVVYVDDQLLDDTISLPYVIPGGAGCLALARLGVTGCNNATGFSALTQSWKETLGQVLLGGAFFTAFWFS